MAELSTTLGILAIVAILYEVARRVGVPYPTLLVVGGLLVALVPEAPNLALEPDVVLLVFLPPLLFSAAFEIPLRELRTYRGPIIRLSIGLVLFTAVLVAATTHAVIPSLDWAAALTLGAIVAPTDALAATSVFRRIGAPRVVRTLIEGESLFNDATALVTYRFAVIAAMSGTFVLADAAGGYVAAIVGGSVVGWLVGRGSSEVVRRLDNPTVEVAVSLLIPYAAYLPAEELGFSGVLGAVVAGLIVGRRLGTILSPSSRILWLSTWKMLGFVLNGFAFILIGLQLPEIVAGLGGYTTAELVGLAALVIGVVVGARIVWVFVFSLLPGSPRQTLLPNDRRLARWLTFLVSWAGLRGAVSLAAALALPVDFPARHLILFLTFAVILATLVGQGLTLSYVLRRAAWNGVEPDAEGSTDEPTNAHSVAYAAGLDEVARLRPRWPGHLPLLDRLESGLRDRSDHLATEDPDETAERHQERVEHEEIQRDVIGAQRTAVTELRDRREINDATLREIERELDLEELRMEG
ncbi:MAG TPA: Na+/H+ antiporter [Candidatus Eisenbacteria bacterium]|nr:Na+/H+ antiporter [Candidatus Eisenbacteria bacterium]